VALLRQTEFPEPVMRANANPAPLDTEGWEEAGAWDEYALQFGYAIERFCQVSD